MRLLRRFALLFTVAALAFSFVTCSKESDEKKSAAQEAASTACPDNSSGLTLPSGFCATIFADDIGHARHLVVSSSGVVYANTWSGAYYGNKPPHEGGFLVALKDTKGAGKADVNERFGETAQTGGAGGTGIGIFNGYLYAEINDKIVRYKMASDSVVPSGPAETIVSGLPLGGDHPMHPFIFGSDGSMYVDVATATNACQPKNRVPHSRGLVPCTELKTRGGVWLFDANKTNQKFSPAERYATGIRNAEGFAMDSDGRVFITQHGRDQLHNNWPELYKPEEEATLPAETMMLLKKGGDYGWPECYYDAFQQKLMLAPEYGGDGRKIGVCADKIPPVGVYPAHWAPNALAYYNAKLFPAHYKGGVFIAFHGSWDRAPYPQNGYNVVFQPLSGDHAGGACEIFADGFAGAVKSPGKAEHRPSGLAVGPDGALYVSDDTTGRIYRIDYRGGPEGPAHYTPCPNPASPAEGTSSAEARPPEGSNPDAGKTRVPEGATPEMVATGARIFSGQEGGATCTACHGDNGKGSPLGPDLTDKEWLWSDGSFKGIAKTITDGVMKPKKFRSPMPPKGGSELTDEQVKAVSAYIWSLSH